jgi:hypothetical protein
MEERASEIYGDFNQILLLSPRLMPVSILVPLSHTTYKLVQMRKSSTLVLISQGQELQQHEATNEPPSSKTLPFLRTTGFISTILRQSQQFSFLRSTG